MMPFLVRGLIYPLHEALLRRPTFAYFRSLERTQFLGREELEQLQMEKLKRLLRTAHRHSPWFHRVIGESGIDLGAGSRLDMESLRRLPTMDKQTAREHGAEMVWHGVPGGAYPYNTGGSSGEPLRFYFGRMRQASDAAARMRARRWWGVEPGDREVYLWGAPVELNNTDRIKQFRDRLFNQLVLNAFEMSRASMDEYLEILPRFDPVCIYGYASSLSLLARHARERGLRPGMRSLKVVCTTGEPLYPHQREIIQEVFGVPVANEYGSRDVGFNAHEAPGGQMLMTSESIILEILDERGEPVAPGETGEAVMTGLCSEAQPFIRYRTGDMLSYLEQPAWGGRGLHVLSEVEGRSTDFVLRSDGTVMHALAVIYEIRDKPGVAEFKFIQHELEACEVLVVTAAGWVEGETDRAIIADLRARLGNEVRVRVRQVDEIPPERSGKHRYVVSRVAGRWSGS